MEFKDAGIADAELFLKSFTRLTLSTLSCTDCPLLQYCLTLLNAEDIEMEGGVCEYLRKYFDLKR